MKTGLKCWAMAGLLSIAGVGCDGQARPVRDARAADVPGNAPHVPAPEEALQVPIAKPLAAGTENWIAGSDLGDAWEQAKSTLASLRFRLVEDYERRMESGVGQTDASRDLRKEYLRWVRIHDELKEFILACQTRGAKRELPPKLAENFKDWRTLRRDSLSTGDDEIERWRKEAESLQREIRQLRARGAGAGAADWERLAERVRTGRTAVEELRARTDAVSWQYGADGQVAGLAGRVAELAADWGELSREVEGTVVRQNDRERLEEFVDACGRMQTWMRTLSARVEAKNERIAEERTLARSLRRSSGGTGAAELARFRSDFKQDRSDGLLARRDVRDFQRYFGEKEFAHFLHTFPEGSRPAIAVRFDEVMHAIPAGIKPGAYLKKLETKADQLATKNEESAALAALEAALRQ